MRKKEEDKRRLIELQSIYEEFTPYNFDKSRVKLSLSSVKILELFFSKIARDVGISRTGSQFTRDSRGRAPDRNSRRESRVNLILANPPPS